MEIPELADSLLRGPIVVLDVRSPSEYAAGHIPTALNLPLLNDEERKAVGITYKEKGQADAVVLGFDLVGGKFADYLRTAKQLSAGNQLVVYCARGGMRSAIMGWILSTGGLSLHVLDGGYKSWRNWCLRRFESLYPFIVISGKTGTGKTECLAELAAMGEATIDLEALCVHRGSSFGSLGLPPQPTQEHFENQLALRCETVKGADRVWVEDESRFIGKLRVPDALFLSMSSAPRVELTRTTERRMERIIEEYGAYPKDELIARTQALQKRMGGEQVRDAVLALEADNFMAWVEILLHYYDKSYDFSQIKGQGEREVEWLGRIDPDTADLRTSLASLIRGLNNSRRHGGKN